MAARRVAPGAWSRIRARAELPAELTTPETLGPDAARAAAGLEAGGPVRLAAAARLRKRLIRLLAPETLDHRAGRYAALRARIARAFAADGL